MHPRHLAALGGLATVCAALSAPAAAVEVGQQDTFSSSIEAWFAGRGPLGVEPPEPPAVQAGGGPDGAGDAYLLVTANEPAGPGSRLVAMNDTQWAGDYAAAGVTGISMDLRNFGTTDLTLRLYFEDPVAGPPQNEAVTSFSVSLPSGGDWTNVRFPVGPDDLTVLSGDVGTLLSNTTMLRLYQGTEATFPGEILSGSLGVDNITALGSVTPIPEPATWALLLAGMGCLAGRRGRRVR